MFTELTHYTTAERTSLTQQTGAAVRHIQQRCCDNLTIMFARDSSLARASVELSSAAVVVHDRQQAAHQQLPPFPTTDDDDTRARVSDNAIEELISQRLAEIFTNAGKQSHTDGIVAETARSNGVKDSSTVEAFHATEVQGVKRKRESKLPKFGPKWSASGLFGVTRSSRHKCAFNTQNWRCAF